jgi:hypothetical protein
MRVFRFLAVALVVLVVSARTDAVVRVVQNAPGGSVEEIYVFRSIRALRVVGSEAAELCRTRVTFTSFAHDTSDLVSATVSANGLVVNPLTEVIGKLVTCIGRTDNPDKFDFYGEGEINGIRFKGGGDCLRDADAPLIDATSVRCHNRATVLNDGYVGGLIVSNTLAPIDGSPTGGLPPGYLGTSVAVVRFWKKRCRLTFKWSRAAGTVSGRR